MNTIKLCLTNQNKLFKNKGFCITLLLLFTITAFVYKNICVDYMYQVNNIGQSKINALFSDSVIQPLLGWYFILNVFFIPIINQFNLKLNINDKNLTFLKLSALKPKSILLMQFINILIWLALMNFSIFLLLSPWQLSFTPPWSIIFTALFSLNLNILLLFGLGFLIGLIISNPLIGILSNWVVVFFWIGLSWFAPNTFIIEHLSIINHTQLFNAGIITLADLTFYFIFLAFFFSFGFLLLDKKLQNL